MRKRNYTFVSVATVAATALLLSCASITRLPVVSEPAWLYDTITFEIAPITSADPSPRALELFRKRLHENHICQSDKISFKVRRSVRSIPFGIPWNSGMLSSYEDLRRSEHDDDPQDRDLAVFVAYIDGPWQDLTRIRFLGGLQYSDSAFAIFKRGAADREASVLLHEFGHMIGLVKRESLPNHDGAYRHHCAVQSCAMFHTAPGPYADFDLYCKREIAALIRARKVEEVEEE
jgi:hypothetical protein